MRIPFKIVLAVIFLCQFLLPIERSYAQDKAVVVGQFDMEKVFESKTVKGLGQERLLGQMGFGSAEMEVLQKMSRLDVFIASPSDEFDPRTLMTTNFLVLAEMKDEDIASRIEKDLEGDFVADEIDGKKVWRADGPGAPPIYVSRSGKKLRFGSRKFLLANPDSLVGKETKRLLQQLSDKPAKMVANFDEARGFLKAVEEMANKNAEFMTRQYVSLLGQISNVQMAWDDDGDDLFMARIKGLDAEEDKKIKLKVDAAVGLLKGFSEIGLAEMKKQAPAAAKLSEEILEGIQVTAEKNATLVKLARPGNYEKLLLGAMEDARRSRRNAEDMNRMKQAALAKHNYFDVYRRFPFAEERTENLSWRVNVLPFMEEEKLALEFNMEEKWSSERNRKLISKIPQVFRLSNGATISYIKPKNLPKSFDDVRDGTSNTIVFVENRKAKMIPWTQPEGVSPKQFIAMVKNLDDGDHLLVAFYDGSVRRISNKISDMTLSNLLEPADGNAVRQEEIR